MSDNLLFDPQFNRQILGHFGIDKSDCTFEELAQCARNLIADKPNVTIRRWHDTVIRNLVKSGESIIDLGCGDGELLARISNSARCIVQGVESDEKQVYKCIERGLPVCHADIMDILPIIPDNSFTWAILEDTIQTLVKPMETLEQMLRIAENSIIAFPNFAHWSVRYTFSLGGRMPVTKALPYKWYNTPNIHLCSITDFLDWVESENVTITSSWALVEGEIVPFSRNENHNITAEQALFVVKR